MALDPEITVETLQTTVTKYRARCPICGQKRIDRLRAKAILAIVAHMQKAHHR